MTTASPTSPKTVGQLVAERPERARVFERLGIDYCCGGRKPLEDVCAQRGLDPERVRAELNAADAGPARSDGPDWNTAPLSQLADNIQNTHHALMRAELPRAEALVKKVARAHGERHPELVELDRAFGPFAAEMSSHMVKEESVLFPWIRGLESGRAGQPGMQLSQPVRCLMADHDQAGQALQRMRELTGGFTPPADACGSYRVMLSTLAEIEADMHTHVHKENNILFPRALSLEAAGRA
jgi:regulator of cell morphogenesis and NO signaling